MVGPTILFADYIDFIDGKQFAKKSYNKVTQFRIFVIVLRFFFIFVNSFLHR